MNNTFLSVIGVVAAVLAVTVLRNVELVSQLELVEPLLTVASIVFATLGVWVLVLNPAARTLPSPYLLPALAPRSRSEERR